MQKKRVWEEFESLPPAAQRQAADFIAFLRARTRQHSKKSEASAAPVPQESFVGMWRDREEMQDSTAWVRQTRIREWHG